MKMNKKDALKLFKDKGMKPVSTSIHDFGDRVYYAYDGENAFLDHSGTMTPTKNQNIFHVSDYTYMIEMRKKL